MYVIREMGESEEFNDILAESCMATCAQCCKKGELLILEEEYEEILTWIDRNAPSEREDFLGRCQRHEGFYLYDQKDACGFLDEANLCRLHMDKVKPRECLAWPFHVYVGNEEKLEIRYSTSCCDAFLGIERYSKPAKNYAVEVLSHFDETRIRRFRKNYGGSYDTKYLCDWKPAI